MAYDKQTWVCGDEITADRLNHMEDGIYNAGGGTMKTITLTHTIIDGFDGCQMDASYNDIMSAGIGNCVVKSVEETGEDESNEMYSTICALIKHENEDSAWYSARVSVFYDWRGQERSGIDFDSGIYNGEEFFAESPDDPFVWYVED